MEPRPSEKPVEVGGEDQTAPPRPPERKRRFRIVKLEERIAPSNGKGNSGYHCITSFKPGQCKLPNTSPGQCT
jgi:hypothetical protein